MHALHYIHPLEMQSEDATWCGRSADDPATVTTNHQLVTCRTCLRKVGKALRVCVLSVAKGHQRELLGSARRRR